MSVLGKKMSPQQPQWQLSELPKECELTGLRVPGAGPGRQSLGNLFFFLSHPAHPPVPQGRPVTVTK